ncbi:hypothetical protein Pr1d_31580 [Bythopirellula goksoeyrii]|uniref:Uncharacterized protein n=1 Tax=Bythopirellula goksoeyrii TaxID=1400387 RepID=A0A5B9QED0_9BACT|nr:hypothetical protein Pr1d_31580 [Bythopirellula goksoeyrii]
MTVYKVPVRVEVPAHGEVEVEADSLEKACIHIRDDIREHGFNSIAGEAEFTTDWENATNLSLGRVVLLDGRKFTERS